MRRSKRKLKAMLSALLLGQWCGISKDTLDHFLVKNPRQGRSYLLPKIHKHLNNVSGRLVISNCRFFTENILSRLSFTAISHRNYILRKRHKDFLKKLSLPEDALRCTVDVVGLYPNIPHEDGLGVKKALSSREYQCIFTALITEWA